MQTQVAGVQFSRKAFETAPLRSIVTEESSPGYGTVAEDGSDEAWRQWVNDTCESCLTIINRDAS